MYVSASDIFLVSIIDIDLMILVAKDDVVLSAEELRYAAQEIGKITGRVGVEDVLDVVFQQFCIGK